jgi:hypothetical protein
MEESEIMRAVRVVCFQLSDVMNQISADFAGNNVPL